MEIDIPKEMQAYIFQLVKELGLNEQQVVAYALRVLRDAVDARVITKDLINSLEPTEPRYYAKSWLPALRLHYAISSAAPERDLGRIKRIIIESDGILPKRVGIDWSKDFERFSQFKW